MVVDASAIVALLSDEPEAERVSAAHRYRAGRRGLNLGDCLHYAAARHYAVP